jgi:DNA-binding NarL/FixJ family response regulator
MKQQVRVLIADDRRPTRQGLKALLALYPQVEVVGEAINGQEAARLVAACQPDVVLMDMQMPVMDGLESTQRIKSDWPEVKVIALTMYSQYRTEAFAAGVDAFLIKGCDSEELLAAITFFGYEEDEVGT